MRKLLGLITASVGYILFAAPAFAIDTCPQGDFNALCSKNASSLGTVVGSVITFAFIIAIIIALAYLVYGGIKWILSEGDKGKVEESRNHVIAAVIGLVVVFMSYFILNIVLGFFVKGATLNNLTLPSFGFS